MTTFISDVLNDLKSQNKSFSDLIFILPSKRAGVHLKHQLTQVIDHNILAPEILSIEEFVEELSQLKKASNTELLFILYEVYQKVTDKDKQDGFDSFVTVSYTHLRAHET